MKPVIRTGPDSIATEDGCASLVGIGADSSRDGGGYVYNFEIELDKPSKNKFSGKVLICNNTASTARSHLYRATGKDFNGLSLSERDAITEKYSEEFGSVFRVTRLFGTNIDFNKTDPRLTEFVVDKICSLYFELYILRKLEDSNNSFAREQYYKDKIEFSPPELSRDLWKTFTGQEVLGQ